MAASAGSVLRGNVYVLPAFRAKLLADAFEPCYVHSAVQQALGIQGRSGSDLSLPGFFDFLFYSPLFVLGMCVNPPDALRQARQPHGGLYVLGPLRSQRG